MAGCDRSASLHGHAMPRLREAVPTWCSAPDWNESANLLAIPARLPQSPRPQQ